MKEVSYGYFFPYAVSLPANSIVLQPTGVAFNDFRAEAYVIQPVFSEVSTLTYTLSKDATVSIRITDPNGSAIRTLLESVSQPAGPQTIEWDGRTDSGAVVSVEGTYTVALSGVDPVSGQVTIRNGALTVYR